MHTTYINIVSINFFLISTCFIKSEFFPYLLSVITFLYIDSLSLLFSYIDIDNIKVTGQQRPSDKKKISFISLSLRQCLLLLCLTAKRVEILWYRYLCGGIRVARRDEPWCNHRTRSVVYHIRRERWGLA